MPGPITYPAYDVVQIARTGCSDCWSWRSPPGHLRIPRRLYGLDEPLKEEILVALRDVEIEWVNPETNDDQSGIVEVHLLTPHGMVVLELIRNPLSFPSYKIVEYSAGKAGQTPNYISSGSWACNRDCVDQHAYSHLDNPKYRELISTFLNPMEY